MNEHLCSRNDVTRNNLSQFYLLAADLKLRGEENYILQKRSIENLAIIHDPQDQYHPRAPKPPRSIAVEFDDEKSPPDSTGRI